MENEWEDGKCNALRMVAVRSSMLRGSMCDARVSTKGWGMGLEGARTVP